MRLHPDIEVSLTVTNREQILERISAFEDDLYLSGQPSAQLPVDAHMLIPNPLVVMAGRDHPLAGKRNIPLKRLLDEPIIMRERGSGTRDAMLRAFEARKLPAPVARMEFGNNESIKQAIVAGLGISVLSLHSLVLEGTGGPIAVLDVQGFPLERHWYVIHPRGKRLSVVAAAFLDFVKQEAIQIAANIDRDLGRTRPGPTSPRRPTPER